MELFKSSGGMRLNSARPFGRFFGAVLVAASLPAYAGLELDADATTGNNGGEDWQSLTVEGPGQSGVVPDVGGISTFTGGGSKDISDTTSWSYSTHSTPPKDNITNAYAKASSVGGDLIVYAGLDRYSISGSADAGFWFFQQKVGPVAGSSKFGPGKHTEGDLLIVAEYTQGGRVGTLKVFRWTNGALLQATAGADCVDTAGALPCGRTNSSPITVYWPYSGKGGTSMPAAGAFLEVGVNVSAIARQYGGPVPCFTSFLAETRSSATPDAVLKDFVAGEFPVCAVAITTGCTAGAVNAAQSGFTWTYNGVVTNTGFGTLYGVTVYDSGPDQILNTADDIVVNKGTLGAGDAPTFGGSFDTVGSSPNPSINIARVEAATSPGGTPTVLATSGTATCPAAVVSASISVTKACTSTLDFINNQVVVGINVNGQVCNTGDVGLKNVSVVDDNGTSGTGDDVFLLSGANLAKKGAAGECQNYSGHYNPSGVNAGSSPSSVPHNAAFGDTVSAFGTDVLSSKAVTPATATATCPLCDP